MRPFCGAVLGLVRTPEWMREGPPDLSHSFPPPIPAADSLWASLCWGSCVSPAVLLSVSIPCCGGVQRELRHITIFPFIYLPFHLVCITI